MVEVAVPPGQIETIEKSFWLFVCGNFLRDGFERITAPVVRRKEGVDDCVDCSGGGIRLLQGEAVLDAGACVAGVGQPGAVKNLLALVDEIKQIGIHLRGSSGKPQTSQNRLRQQCLTFAVHVHTVTGHDVVGVGRPRFGKMGVDRCVQVNHHPDRLIKAEHPFCIAIEH